MPLGTLVTDTEVFAMEKAAATGPLGESDP